MRQKSLRNLSDTPYSIVIRKPNEFDVLITAVNPGEYFFVTQISKEVAERMKWDRIEKD